MKKLYGEILIFITFNLALPYTKTFIQVETRAFHYVFPSSSKISAYKNFPETCTIRNKNLKSHSNCKSAPVGLCARSSARKAETYNHMSSLSLPPSLFLSPSLFRYPLTHVLFVFALFSSCSLSYPSLSRMRLSSLSFSPSRSHTHRCKSSYVSINAARTFRFGRCKKPILLLFANTYFA